MSEGEACRAVLALEPSDAADLAARWSAGRVWLDDHMKVDDARARILSACLRVLDLLRARGFDTDALFRTALDDRSQSSLDVGILAIACVRAHPGSLDASFVPLLARAAAQGWWQSALLEEMRALDAASLRAVLHAIEPNQHALPFLALGLDAVVVEHLVLRSWPQDADAVVVFLSRAPAAIADVLERIAYPSDAARARREPLARRAIDAIRARG